MALNKSKSYNVCETASLVSASEEESEAEISDGDVVFPLSAGENQHIISDDSSEEEDETSRPS